MDARRKKASALQLRFSQSLANLRQPSSQAMVRSAIQRRGSTTTFGEIGTPDDFNFEVRQSIREPVAERRSLIAAISKELFQEWIHPQQRRQKQDAAIAILNVGRMDDRVELTAPLDQDPGGTRACTVPEAGMSANQRDVSGRTVRSLTDREEGRRLRATATSTNNRRDGEHVAVKLLERKLAANHQQGE
jgi:hypothetical protein